MIILGREPGKMELGEECPGGVASKESPSRWLRREEMKTRESMQQELHFCELIKKAEPVWREVKDI